MRRLILIRHAHAEVGSAEAGDRARALTPRGRAEAAAIGQWLAVAGFAADRVLVSPARRTRETWQIAAAAGASGEGMPTEALYDADPVTVLQLVRGCDAAVGTLALVGHNPTFHEAAQAFLADTEGAGLDDGFPPATVAVLGFAEAAAWRDVGAGRAALDGYVTPRRLGARP